MPPIQPHQSVFIFSAAVAFANGTRHLCFPRKHLAPNGNQAEFLAWVTDQINRLFRWERVESITVSATLEIADEPIVWAVSRESITAPIAPLIADDLTSLSPDRI